MKHLKACAIETFENTPNSILIHQVNCQGAMGSGIAYQIRNKYPKHYNAYKLLCSEYPPESLLGEFILEDNVAGIFGQLNYGKGGKQYTSYADLSGGICDMIEGLRNETMLIIPKYIGCGLGGGDWDTVEHILLDIESMYSVEFIVCEV